MAHLKDRVATFSDSLAKPLKTAVTNIDEAGLKKLAFATTSYSRENNTALISSSDPAEQLLAPRQIRRRGQLRYSPYRNSGTRQIFTDGPYSSGDELEHYIGREDSDANGGEFEYSLVAFSELAKFNYDPPDSKFPFHWHFCLGFNFLAAIGGRIGSTGTSASINIHESFSTSIKLRPDMETHVGIKIYKPDNDGDDGSASYNMSLSNKTRGNTVFFTRSLEADDTARGAIFLRDWPQDVDLEDTIECTITSTVSVGMTGSASQSSIHHSTLACYYREYPQN